VEGLRKAWRSLRVQEDFFGSQWVGTIILAIFEFAIVACILADCIVTRNSTALSWIIPNAIVMHLVGLYDRRRWALLVSALFGIGGLAATLLAFYTAMQFTRGEAISVLVALVMLAIPGSVCYYAAKIGFRTLGRMRGEWRQKSLELQDAVVLDPLSTSVSARGGVSSL